MGIVSLPTRPDVVTDNKRRGVEPTVKEDAAATGRVKAIYDYDTQAIGDLQLNLLYLTNDTDHDYMVEGFNLAVNPEAEPDLIANTLGDLDGDGNDEFNVHAMTWNTPVSFDPPIRVESGGEFQLQSMEMNSTRANAADVWGIIYYREA